MSLLTLPSWNCRETPWRQLNRFPVTVMSPCRAAVLGKCLVCGSWERCGEQVSVHRSGNWSKCFRRARAKWREADSFTALRVRVKAADVMRSKSIINRLVVVAVCSEVLHVSSVTACLCVLQKLLVCLRRHDRGQVWGRLARFNSSVCSQRVLSEDKTDYD